MQSVLTAPELIAVNQDPRSAQGYIVFDRDECEIYNKPLADGTTAVMLLNKGREPADVTVYWEAIIIPPNEWPCTVNLGLKTRSWNMLQKTYNA